MILFEVYRKAARLWFSTALAAALILGLLSLHAHAQTSPATAAIPQTADGDEVIGAGGSIGRLESGEVIQPNKYIENESRIVLEENREPIGRDMEAIRLRIAADAGTGVAVLTGDPGIGKSEVVRQYIYDNPTHIVYRLKTEALISLSRADRASVVKSVLIYTSKLAKAHPDIVTRLHIDNLPFLNEGGVTEIKASGAITESVAAKRPLSMIIETNAATNKKLKEASPTFGELQNEVTVETPKFDSVVGYLKNAHAQLESATRVPISLDALTTAAHLALRFEANDPYRKAYEIVRTAGYRVAEDLRRGETEVRQAKRELAKIETELKIIEKDLAFGPDPAKEARKTELKTEKTKLDKLIKGRETVDASTARDIADLVREIEVQKGELEVTPEGKFFMGKQRRDIEHRIAELSAKLEVKRAEIQPPGADGPPPKQVVPKSIESALAVMRPDLDESMISMNIKDGIKRIKRIKDPDEGKLYGQDHLVDRAATAVARGLKERELFEEEMANNPGKKVNRRKPIWSVLIPGRTGTGKTEFGIQLAEALGLPVLKIHMSTYTEKHHASGLIGARPEYSGHGQDGELTGPVRKSPALLIILDEIQRADIDVIKTIVYPVLDQGEIKDSEGRTVYFDQAIIVAPTNAGERFSSMERPDLIDFLKAHQTHLRDQDLAVMTLPELRGQCVRIDMMVTYHWEESMVGRFDDVMSSNNIDKTMKRMIVAKNVKDLVKALQSRGITLRLNENMIQFLIDSFNEAEGARSIETEFKRTVKDPLMAMWGTDKIKKGDVVIARLDGRMMVPTVMSLETYNSVSNQREQKLIEVLARQGRTLEKSGFKPKAEFFDDAFMVRNAVAKTLERFGRK